MNSALTLGRVRREARLAGDVVSVLRFARIAVRTTGSIPFHAKSIPGTPQGSCPACCCGCKRASLHILRRETFCHQPTKLTTNPRDGLKARIGSKLKETGRKEVTLIAYSPFFKPIFWTIMGLIYALTVFGAPIWAQDLGLHMTW